MERISGKFGGFDAKENENIKNAKQAACDEIYSSTYVREFLESNNLDSEFVSKHLVELLEMKRSADNCENCEGYLKCKNTPKGNIQRYDLEQQENIYVDCSKLASINPVKNKYLVCDFPEDWLFADINEFKNNVFVKSVVNKITKDFVSNQNKGFYICGGSGTGKSYISAAFANYLLKNKFKENAAFINYKNFLEDLKSNFDDNTYSDVQIAKMQNVDLLVIDDLGGEKVSEWTIHQVLFEILQERLRNRKMTIITSMYSLNSLSKLYGGNNPKTDRVIKTIENLTNLVVIEGVNFNEI